MTLLSYRRNYYYCGYCSNYYSNYYY